MAQERLYMVGNWTRPTTAAPRKTEATTDTTALAAQAAAGACARARRLGLSPRAARGSSLLKVLRPVGALGAVVVWGGGALRRCCRLRALGMTTPILNFTTVIASAHVISVGP